MHDPMVVVFDVPLPVPKRRRWSDARSGEPCWTFGRMRRTNPENLGEPVYPWFRPCGWTPRLAGRAYEMPTLATVWHVEPEGRDSGTVCKGMRGSDANWHNIRWAWKHRAHLQINVEPYLRVRRWLLQRCEGCGRRFFWKDGRFGYMSSDKVWHAQCMSLRSVRSQLDDLTEYVLATADDNARWRVEYRLKSLTEKSESPRA